MHEEKECNRLLLCRKCCEKKFFSTLIYVLGFFQKNVHSILQMNVSQSVNKPYEACFHFIISLSILHQKLAKFLWIADHPGSQAVVGKHKIQALSVTHWSLCFPVRKGRMFSALLFLHSQSNHLCQHTKDVKSVHLTKYIQMSTIAVCNQRKVNITGVLANRRKSWISLQLRYLVDFISN